MTVKLECVLYWINPPILKIRFSNSANLRKHKLQK